MMTDEQYMRRCFELAQQGRACVSPNPMVGAVLVCDDRIIGEGFHRQYGEAHAEVNAIANVKNKQLLTQSTIYVSLEPCAHHGKTPPCAQLIIDMQIPRVVIASLDPFSKVAGKGLQMLREAGVDVQVGVLEQEACELNKEFFTAQTQNRPYIYLKWAQTKDGFIDKERLSDEEPHSTPISTSFTKMLVHKQRSEVGSIMIATNTAVKDNPSLTTRLWYGRSPVRVILDRSGRIPHSYKIFDNEVKTLIFTESVSSLVRDGQTEYIPIRFDTNILVELMRELQQRKINSILVEGGRKLLQSFIDHKLWDEAFVEIADKNFERGVRAPSIDGKVLSEHLFDGSKQVHIRSFETYNFL